MKKLFAITFLFVFLLSTHVHGETVNVSVAASMTDVFKEINSQFSTQYQNIAVRMNSGGSGGLARQIDQGAPIDLFVSANPKWISYLVQNSRIDKENVRLLACNSLVFAGLESSDEVTGFADLPHLRRIAIGSPQSVPAGEYAKQALGNGGVYNMLVKGRKLVFAKDVRQALLYADRGEVDGAFVYATDVVLVKGAKVLFQVPVELHDPVEYPMALTAIGNEKEAAQIYFRFLQQPEVKKILLRHGFTTAS